MTEDLAEIWKEFLSVIQSQVDAVEKAVRAAAAQQLTDDLRKEGIANAHKLAGSLGSFELNEASLAARQIERTLLAGEAIDAVKAGELTALAAALRRDIESA